MKVYFYHTQDIQYILQRMEEGAFPSHFLYGATHLKEHGIEVIWHPSDIRLSGWRRMLRTTWKVLTCRERFDAVFATHYTGIEPLIFLRALRLFRKPIVIWHHQPIITPRQHWREWLGRLFYKGIDQMFFFSQKLINDSLSSPKARPERMHLGHWGADLELYDRIMHEDYKDYPYFDFGRSTEHPDGSGLNEPLVFQKEGFGGRGLCYDIYEYDL